MILVLMDLENKSQRAEESERLLAWGFREFTKYRLFQAGEMLDEASVWMGEESSVPLVAPAEISVNLLRANRSGMSVKLIYQSPLAAPIQAGEKIAILTVAAPDHYRRRGGERQVHPSRSPGGKLARRRLAGAIDPRAWRHRGC